MPQHDSATVERGNCVLGWLLLALAAPQAAAADPCVAPAACRRVEGVRVQAPDGKETVLPINQTLPWVVQGNLLLVPGDWIVVRLVDEGGKLTPALVKAGHGGGAPAPAEGEIRVQVHDFQRGNLIMEIVSRRPETLDYGALVVVGIDKPRRTSVCSLQPGIPVFESWQWPIRQIALFNFRPTTEPGCKTIDVKPASEKPKPTV
jgi:hypothetical protein